MKSSILVTALTILAFHVAWAQKKAPAYLRLNDIAPNFTAPSTKGTIRFYEWVGKNWAILFSHPSDFTPVCTTELGDVAKLDWKFEAMGVRVLALSVDSLASHHRWIADINETQDTKVGFPIIADPDFKVASLYGMVHPNASVKATVRSVFIIDPDKKIKLILTYPASTGRNFDEILRVIESLQLTATYNVSTPANWQPGEDVIIPTTIKNEDLPRLYPRGYQIIKPYLRTTPQPYSQDAGK